MKQRMDPDRDETRSGQSSRPHCRESGVPAYSRNVMTESFHPRLQTAHRAPQKGT